MAGDEDYVVTTLPGSDPSQDITQDVVSNVVTELQQAAKKRTKAVSQLAKIFGHIPGISIGVVWPSRLECSNAGVHRSIVAGICGTKNDGANSIVLSNMYDDVDGGETIIYQGAGGRKRWSDSVPPKRLRCGPQIYDQEWSDWGNSALVVSEATGLPVRVVRGCKGVSKYAPVEGYRYDGLYTVVAHWREENSKGLKVCRYRLERLPGQPPIPERGPQMLSTPRSTQHQNQSPSGSNGCVQGSTRKRRYNTDPDDPSVDLPGSYSRDQTLVAGDVSLPRDLPLTATGAQNPSPAKPQASSPAKHAPPSVKKYRWNLSAAHHEDEDSQSVLDEALVNGDVKPTVDRRLSTESADFGPISPVSTSRALSIGVPFMRPNSTSSELTPREPSMNPEPE